MTAWRVTYDLHGVAMRWESESLALGQAVDRRLAAFRVAESPGAGMAFTATFGSLDSDVRLQRGRDVYERPGGAVRYDEQGDALLLLEPGRASMVCRPTEGIATIRLADESPSTVWLVSHGMTTIALLEVLKRRDLFGLHAAAVVADGRAVLLPAASGGGKTTTCLLLTRAGLAFMSDDLTIVRDGGTELGLQALAVPDEVDLCADTPSLLPWLAAATHGMAVPEGYPKLPLDIRLAVPGARITMGATPGAIVLPRIVDRDACSLSSVQRDRAFNSLLPSLLLTDAASSQRFLDVVSSLCATTPCYQLDLGRRLDTVPELVLQALNSGGH